MVIKWETSHLKKKFDINYKMVQLYFTLVILQSVLVDLIFINKLYLLLCMHDGETKGSETMTNFWWN